jgi:hypothetical protein
MTNASVLPRFSRDADARMRAALDRKSSIATNYISSFLLDPLENSNLGAHRWLGVWASRCT